MNTKVADMKGKGIKIPKSKLSKMEELKITKRDHERANRIVDQLETLKILGPFQGARRRVF